MFEWVDFAKISPREFTNKPKLAKSLVKFKIITSGRFNRNMFSRKIGKLFL